MINYSDLVRQKKAEAETQESRSGDKSLVNPRGASRRDHERRGDRSRDQRHSDDRADTKDREIQRRPQRVGDRAEHQQRNRRAARQSMHHSHAERPEQRPPRRQRRHRAAVDPMIVMRGFAGCFVRIGMDVRMRMDRIAVRMGVRMDDQFGAGGRASAQSNHRVTNEICRRSDAQQDQHDCHGELHRQSKPRRDRNFENDYSRADDQHSQSMAEAPHHPDSRGDRKPSLAAQNRCDRDHVIGIGRMTHPEHQSQERDRKRRCVVWAHFVRHYTQIFFRRKKRRLLDTKRSLGERSAYYEHQYRTLQNRCD